MSASHVRIPATVASLAPFCEAGVLAASDVHLADWVSRTSGVQQPELAFAVAMASWAARQGHSCAQLDALPEVVRRELRSRSDDDSAVEGPTLPWPDATAVVSALTALPQVVRVAAIPDATPVLDDHPVVLHQRSVYLQRHWVDECIIAQSLRQRAADVPVALHPSSLALLDTLLPASVDGEVNLQRAAADVVLRNRMAVVVGGPGTGKTYTVARLLAVLLHQAHTEGHHLRVGLAAPTGKAAQRLRESILASLQHDDPLSAEVRDALAALEPRTIHKLLGSKGGHFQRFQHDAANPMPHDVVVIDETSMVSAPLLARLLEGVHPAARIVFLGDPDQLESVDRGAVLTDIVQASVRSDATGPLAGRGVRLLRGHRFGDDSHIARFADAVRSGDPDVAVARLREAPPLDADGAGVRFVETTDPLHADVQAALGAVLQPLLTRMREAAEQGDAAVALDAMAHARVLCAHREGRFGVSTWNRLGEQWACGPQGAPSAWYAGRPLLVTGNDPRLGLSNGDVGVVVRQGDRLVVAFPDRPDRFDPVQLESVETSYATTVHKSQGSEYPAVVMVLPPHQSPLVGRELVYTGVTRAKRTLLVVGSEAAVRACVASPARRMTGLAAALSSP